MFCPWLDFQNTTFLFSDPHSQRPPGVSKRQEAPPSVDRPPRLLPASACFSLPRTRFTPAVNDGGLHQPPFLPPLSSSFHRERFPGRRPAQAQERLRDLPEESWGGSGLQLLLLRGDAQRLQDRARDPVLQKMPTGRGQGQGRQLRVHYGLYPGWDSIALAVQMPR
jgi:hypothetical protein